MSKAWIAGKGHAASDKSSGKLFSGDAKAAAASAIPGVMAAAMGSKPATAPADESFAKLVKGVMAATAGLPGGVPTGVGISVIASESGLSTVAVRFMVSSSGVRERLSESGFTIGSVDGDSVSVMRGTTETVAVKATRKRVRAAAVAADVVASDEPKPADKKIESDFFAFNKLVATKIRAAIKAGINFWLVGETGCGKSEYYERIFEELGRKVDDTLFVKVSFNGESSVDDLLGHYTLRGGETVWLEGALPKAMKKGLPLICEEIDAAPAEANLALQRALEVRAGKARRFYNPRNGEEVSASDGFAIYATANTAGGGDHSGIYAGVQVQNAAFRDRFAFERVTYPEPKIEAEILMRRYGIASELADRAVQFATLARTSLKNGEVFTPVSTRSLLAFANLLVAFTADGMDERTAIKEALLSATIYKSGNPADETAFRGLIQRVFGIS